MLSRRNLQTHVGAIWACAASLMLALAVAGCGTDDDTYVQTAETATPAKATNVLPTPIPEPVPIEIAEMRPVMPEPPREVTYDDAEAAYKDRNYEEAVELFGSYTERKSENPWGHYMLALSAWKASQLETAEVAFNRALALDSNHVKSYVNLSRVLLEMERPLDAVTQIDAALALDPESNTAYRLQGRAFHQLGRTEESIEAYRQAIQIDNEDAWAMNNLALVFIEDGQFDDALLPLARAIELRSDIAVFLNNLGMALERTGHFRDAEDAYNSALTVDESYAKAAINFDRISGVIQDPEVGAVDLVALAQQFADSLVRESVTLAASESIEETRVAPTTIEADTTSSDD